MRKMEKEEARIFGEIVRWAYNNEVEVSFRVHSSYEQSWPVLRFSKHDSHIEQAFWPLTDLKGQAEHCWRKIGMALCIEPLDLT